MSTVATHRIVIDVAVWDAPHRDPRNWDIKDLAEMAFGEEPDEVTFVTVEEVTSGINLDSESVLAEMTESDSYSEADIEAVEALGAKEINDALRDAADDAFWTAYDSVRGDAIQYLIRKAANR